MSFVDLSYLASEQMGLFTTAQANDRGVGRVKLHREVNVGTLRSVRRGVYVFTSAPWSPDEELRAAWLSLDPSRTVAQRLEDPTAIVVCTTSAAACYGIGDFDTFQHEFFTASRKQARAEDIRLRVRHLDNSDVEIRQGLPLATPTRIVLDLLAERFDLGHISRLIADAISQGRYLDWPRIASGLGDHARAYGVNAAQLLEALVTASESPINTTRTVLSMMAGHPDLSLSLSQQLAGSLEQISTALVASSPPEKPADRQAPRATQSGRELLLSRSPDPESWALYGGQQGRESDNNRDDVDQ